MNIQIRRAAVKDYEAVCALYEEIDALHRTHLPQLFQKTNGPAREREYFQGLLADENVGFFVAEINGALVGFVHAFVRDAPDIPIFTPRRYAVVDCIVVKAEQQKNGFGRLLMAHMEAWAADKGAGSIELNVYEFNQGAVSFYEGLGYQTLSRKLKKI
jgi:ribosomal protein S18 acetylase RimI-like enzyme